MAWTEWMPFPDPRKHGMLTAPFGPGCYEVRHRNGGKLVLFGKGNNTALRFTSLLPAPHGQGTRNNTDKRAYCLTHIDNLDYRTLACATKADVVIEENKMKARAADYIFRT